MTTPDRITADKTQSTYSPPDRETLAMRVPATIRGPLKFEVLTSTPQLEAGKPFSISLRVTNPYDVPVTCRGVQTKLPVKFTPASEHRWTRKFREGFAAILFGASGGETVFASRPMDSSEKVGETGVVSTAVDSTDNDTVSHGVVLQPGNSTVHMFRVRTTYALLFVPGEYNLNLEILYDIDGRTNRDTVNYRMNVRAPVTAMIWGSVIGSVIGFAVRTYYEATTPGSGGTASTAAGFQVSSWSLWFGLLVQILIGGIIVVAFARKKDAQPILAIEDLWGGILIGFLAGYGGKAFLQQVVGKG